MIRINSDTQTTRKLDAIAWLLGVPLLAWFLGNWLLERDIQSVIVDAMVLTAAILSVVILSRWRLGLYLFFVWLVFEDFARKYLGNGVYTFFGKDLLLAVVYLAFFFRRGPRTEKLFRPPFWLPLVALILWSAMEAFNFQTASPLYGLLGLKLYFYYVPLMFVGYALVRDEFELRRFLAFNIFIGGVVALLGILQAIFGQSLLNPAVLDESLEGLGNLERSSPLTGLVFNRPTSVFVSDGRFGDYLLLIMILTLGAMGYFIQRRWVWSAVVYISFGVVFVATLLAGVRTVFIFVGLSIVLVATAAYWGQRFRADQLRRIFRVLRRMALLGAIGSACLVAFFPDAVASRWAFYTETLSPTGRGSELHGRVVDYPLSELEKVMDRPEVILGRGLGTASLGTQYIMRFLHAPSPGFAVENGYGQLLLEIGIPGFILWQILSFALLWYCWSVVKRLRNTPLFSLGFAIWWFVLLVMYPLTYMGLSTYQNYLITAFLWILIGVLFRLPSLRQALPAPAVSVPNPNLRVPSYDRALFPVSKPLGEPPPASG
jgi:hypothetical protein